MYPLEVLRAQLRDAVDQVGHQRRVGVLAPLAQRLVDGLEGGGGVQSQREHRRPVQIRRRRLRVLDEIIERHALVPLVQLLGAEAGGQVLLLRWLREHIVQPVAVRPSERVAVGAHVGGEFREDGVCEERGKEGEE